MIEYDRYAVGRVVRQLRKERGLSQEVFSGLCGLARSHIAMIERGTKQANFETLWKIANACEILPLTACRADRARDPKMRNKKAC